MSNRATLKDKKKLIKTENVIEQKAQSSEHLHQASKKVRKVVRNIEEDVDSSEDSDQDDVEPPSTPPRAKRDKDSCTHDTPASVPFQTPTADESPTLLASPKRVKKSSSPSSEVPPFALPSPSNNDAPQPDTIEHELSGSTAFNTPVTQYVTSPAPPVGGHVVGSTLVGALTTAAVLAVVVSARQKLDDCVRNCIYVMPGNMKKIWVKNAYPPHHVDLYSTYGVTCEGHLVECIIFGTKASTFELVFR